MTLTVLMLAASPGASAGADTVPLNVVYGPEALTREGDVDYRETVYISIPADTAGRLYVRVFDPEAVGAHDTAYGRWGDTTTLFRLIGRQGAFTAGPRPLRVADGADAAAGQDGAADASGGEILAERRFGPDPATDGAWAAIGAITAADGEQKDGRAYFRLDVIGETGDEGNVFSVGISRSATRDEDAGDVRMFAFQPTIRWPGGRDLVELGFAARAGVPLYLQNFDAAGGALGIVTTYDELPLRSSYQDVWVGDEITLPADDTALTFKGGAETPNDLTVALFDGDEPVAFTMPPQLLGAASRPVASARVQPLAECRSAGFDAGEIAGVPPFGVLWRFGDGATSQDPVGVHQYAAPGRYRAELLVRSRSGRVASGARFGLDVHIRSAPFAVAGDPVVAAPGDVISFDGASSVASDTPIRRWLWSFGDGARGDGVRTSHSYREPGEYRAALRVEDDADHPCNFGVAIRNVRVNFQPVAEAGEARTVAVGQAVRLTGDASYDIDGQIVDWIWDFGDGSRASGAVTDHAFAAPGVYTVRLSVRDDAGVANSAASDVTRIIVNAPPVAAVDGPGRPLAVGEIGKFSAAASADPDGEILYYDWDFGNGAVATGQAVDYAYNAPGQYDVRLTVRDNSGTFSDTNATIFPVVVSAAPRADAGPDRVLTTSEVIFDASGSRDPDGAISSWEWEFGDGGKATGETVRHAYAQPGVYEVLLRVRDDSGAPLNVDEDRALVRINSAAIADAGPDLLGSPGQDMILDGSNSLDPDGHVSTWTWRFEDGTEKAGRRIAHRFDEPGLHRVELVVMDDTQQEAAADVDEILVRINAPPVAVAGSAVLTEPGKTVRLGGENSFDPDGSIVSYRWDFSDLSEPVPGSAVERVFDAPGTYKAQLTVSDDSGLLDAVSSDEVTIRVNAAPVAEAGAPIYTDSLYVTFDASGSVDSDNDLLQYTWDFGDGSPRGTGQAVKHVYARSGIFPVTLLVDDGNRLPNSVSADTTRVVIDSRPVAAAGGNREACSGEQILFDASASRDPDGGLLQYAWDFGDGTRAGLVNPTKVYERPGVFPVTLTVRDESGLPSGVHADRVAVIVHEAPIADAGLALNACTGQEIRFDGSGSTDADGAVDAFAWNFGDGTTGAGERPVHAYEKPGSYLVVLTITGSSGGRCNPLDTDETRVTVVEAPKVAIRGPDVVPAGAPARWEAVIDAGSAEPTEFTWDFGDGTVVTGPVAEHVFSEPGRHVVSVSAVRTGGSGDCGALSTQLQVTANAAPSAAFDAPRTVAVGEEVLFDASASSDTDGAVVRFAWDFGDGTTSEGVQVAHRFAAGGTYDVRLEVTDDAGVANSTASYSAAVAVGSPPVANLKLETNVCPGDKQLLSSSSLPGDATSWNIGRLSADAAQKIEHIFNAPGIYPVSVTVDDGRGLSSSVATETAAVRVNQPPVPEAGPDRLVCPGERVTFDGSGSTDADGQIADWRWEFDDGVTLAGRLVARDFAKPGLYRARLIVTDDSGTSCASQSDIAAVRVNAPPVVDAGPPQEGPVGAAHDEFLFVAANAADPDGDGTRITWDLGDGTLKSGKIVKHRYAAPGEYVVRASANDGTGLACGIASDDTRVRAWARE